MDSYINRHVVITGGTGALGTGIVAQLLAQGATCHVPLFRAEHRDGYAFTGHERVHLGGPVNLSDEAAVEAYYDRLPPLWASVHVAGGFAMGPLTETSLDDFQRMLNMNAVTAFLCSREAVKRMRANDHGGGRIVNVGARPALVPTPGMIAYATSKAAVTAMTTALAEELASEGIWVNAVIPSVMDTPANRLGMPDADHDVWPSVADVAQTVTFLASPDNAATRGGLVPVYGRS
jgi:NAD(P)-dependent dehydrogenase (short-subunit alcohol dehydrogenase family)